MTWNYRVIRHEDGSLALHEVYYRHDGTPWALTDDPAGFVANAEDGPEGLVRAIETALRDARERPVLDVTAFAAGDVTRDAALMPPSAGDKSLSYRGRVLGSERAGEQAHPTERWNSRPGTWSNLIEAGEPDDRT